MRCFNSSSTVLKIKGLNCLKINLLPWVIPGGLLVPKKMPDTAPFEEHPDLFAICIDDIPWNETGTESSGLWNWRSGSMRER